MSRLIRPTHLATLINRRGRVSALCYDKPRAIVLTRANWTNRREAVSCKKCLRLIKGFENVTNPPQPLVAGR